MMHHNSHPTHHPHIHPPIHPSLQQQHPPQHMGQQMPHHMPPNMNHHSATGTHHGFPRDQMNRLGHHQRINHHQIHPNHGRVAKPQCGVQQQHSTMLMGQQQQQQVKPHGGMTTGGGVPSGAASQHHPQQQKKPQQQQQKQIQQMQVTQNQNSQSSQRLLQTIETKPNPTTTNTSSTGPNIPTVSAATATPAAPLQETKSKIEISGPDVEATKDKSQQSATSETLANIKEKTPMCLVNELARHNKIQHQYRLTCEQGPAHKKKFTVILKLGEEEYTAEGPSIKKAQHSAAADAISATKYKHPPTKTNRTRGGSKGSENHVGNITPTVELNALAMKRGEQTVYVTEHPMKGVNGMQPPPPPPPYAQPQQQSGGTGGGYMAPSHPLNPHATSYSGHASFGSYQTRGGATGMPNVYPQPMSRFHSFDKRSIPGRGFPQRNPPPMANQFPPGSFEPYRVTLTVGERQFVGVGNTQQAARHDAASRALEVLKPITSDSPNQDISLTEDINAELKSPISLVHEMALKRNLTVGFEVKTEKGPPHMKIFVTICTVGTLKTEGEGNGKKISKKRAAEAMLDELKKLPPISPTQRIIKQKRKPQDAVKKKTRNLIKEKDDPEYHAEVNAISKLIQIQQSKKEKEPVYALAEERGVPRRREFVIEVSASGMTAIGVGSNKKLAKRLAAESLLTLMGYGMGKEKGGESGGESTASSTPSPEKGKKVTFQERTDTTAVATNQGGSAGRQLVPGLLLMQQKDGSNAGKGEKGRNTVLNPHTTAAIAKEFLAGGTSPTAEALTKTEQQTAKTINNNVTSEKTNDVQSSVVTEGIRPKEQLLYLAQLIGFNAQFSDFPKGNHGEFLTLITLSTDPPQLCHGSGNSIEASHDQASTKMLTMLSELGLDNVHPVKAQTTPSTPPVDDTKKPKPILTNGLKK